MNNFPSSQQMNELAFHPNLALMFSFPKKKLLKPFLNLTFLSYD